jgi:hypothetical protein
LISRALHPDVFDQPERKPFFQQHGRGCYKNNISKYKWEEIFTYSPFHFFTAVMPLVGFLCLNFGESPGDF